MSNDKNTLLLGVIRKVIEVTLKYPFAPLHEREYCLKAALAAVETMEQGEQTAPGWQPIETAPKDGTPILLGRAESEFHTAESTVGWWQEAVEDGVDYMGGDAGFVDFAFQVFNPGRSFGNPKYMHAADQPTHWMPLPKSPETKE